MKIITQLRSLIILVSASLISQSIQAADQVVTNNSDTGVGSLRQAITDVTDGGTITFNLASGSETITLASELSITKSVTINGSNAAGSGTDVTIRVTTPGVGGSAWRIFNINASGKNISIFNMTLNGGDISAVPGGGAFTVRLEPLQWMQLLFRGPKPTMEVPFIRLVQQPLAIALLITTQLPAGVHYFLKTVHYM